ncbi:MAG: DUF1987 domain-containing protein [Bacteroidota bacterium]
MGPLKIESTKFTPKIIFDPENHVFLVSGFSLPENVADFYAPVLEWLDEFIKLVPEKSGYFNFTFRLIYYNSGSFKVIINMLIKIVSLKKKKSCNVCIDWYYDQEDNHLRDIGEELSELVGLPFNYIAN